MGSEPMDAAHVLAAKLRSGEVSAVELVERCLARLEVASDLHAVAHLDAQRAMDEAREADRVWATEEQLGPLHGLPVSVKAVFDVAGLPADAAIEERRGIVAARDATVVARLRAAGAIIVATTNTPPGGVGGETDNPLHGRAENPYDRARGPGGSSGGEAVVQALGASALGVGSDSGGSIRVPAHLCGVAGLKPTTGRIPATGAYLHPGGLSDPRTQVGPLARTIADLGLVLPVLAGPDDIDPGVVPVPLGPEPSNVRGLRVAVYEDDDRRGSSKSVRAAVRAAVGALDEAGAEVVEARPERIGVDSRDITQRYWTMERATGEQVEQLFADWDGFRRRMLAFMAEVDAILCPVARDSARPHGDPFPDLFDLTLPFSLSGQPAAVVRAGTDGDGLPVGVQLVGRMWRDEVVLALAAVVETATGGWRPPPM